MCINKYQKYMQHIHTNKHKYINQNEYHLTALNCSTWSICSFYLYLTNLIPAEDFSILDWVTVFVVREYNEAYKSAGQCENRPKKCCQHICSTK